MTRRVREPNERIRVMVVDDSVVIRRLVTRALEQDPAIQVVGTASNGVLGLQRIPQLNPDVVTLDIEMPDMDGLEMLRCIRRDYPHLRVIMFSTLTERGAAITLEALTLGADDYVAKVSNEGSLHQSMLRLQTQMIPKIKQFFRSSLYDEATNTRSATRPACTPAQCNKTPPEVLVIGTSTGGPAALAELLPLLPSDYPLPILIVQHMPPLFTHFLSERLNSLCSLHVEEASHGSSVAAGKVLIAPGDFHMKVVATSGGVTVGLDQTPQQNFCRPAVDVLFRSAARVYGSAVLAVVLTGMGHDGLLGTEVLKARGARVFAQDEASSVVWGMPGAIANASLADRVLPISQMATEIIRCSEGR